MVRIHINRNRESLGTFSPDEVAFGLKSGRFLATDLGWKEGMESWLPLAEFQDLPEPAADFTSPVPAEVLLPSGTEVAVAVGASPAWERRTELGLPAAVVQTVQQVLGAPQKTFSEMAPAGKLTDTLVYLLVVGVPVMVINLIFSGILNTIAPGEMMKQSAQYTPGVMWFGLILLAVISPILISLGAFIYSGLMHLFLMLTGGANEPFRATFRVCGYATGSAYVLQLVPICGPLVSGIWNLYVTVVGLRVVHKTDTWRVVVAVLMPVVLLCGCFAAILAVAIGAATK